VGMPTVYNLKRQGAGMRGYLGGGRGKMGSWGYLLALSKGNVKREWCLKEANSRP